MKAWFLLAIFLSACGFDRSGLSGDASSVDANATDATIPDAEWCTGSNPTCQSDTVLEDCVNGTVQPVMPPCAPHTCIGEPGLASCGTVTPSNGIDMTAFAAAGAITVPATEIWAVRTTDGLITSCGIMAVDDVEIRQAGQGERNGIRYQNGSPPTLGFESLTVTAGAEVRFYGSDAIALVTATSMEIHGQLTISGGGLACTSSIDQVCGRATGFQRCGGSGGFWGGFSDANGSGAGGGQAIAASGAEFEFGGGGGGFGATGGRGGPDSFAMMDGPMGGVIYGSARLAPLEGGSGGAGGGLGGAGTAGLGGGGGGAIQLTSFETLIISASGRIKATGAGGERGAAAGAGGGGAGGAILLEAPSLQIIAGGMLSANGGGGGGGDLDPPATNGADGDFGAAQASGGAAGPHAGGAGGSLDNLAGSPGLQSGTTDGTGGGGGAVGRIFFRSRVGGFDVTTTTGAISPQDGRDTDLVQP